MKKMSNLAGAFFRESCVRWEQDMVLLDEDGLWIIRCEDYIPSIIQVSPVIAIEYSST